MDLCKAFPVSAIGDITSTELPKDIIEVSDTFSFPFMPAAT